MVRVAKEPVSAYTHFAGLAAAAVGLVPLLAMARGDALKLTGMSLYGGALLLVFLSSSAYHFFDLGDRGNRWLQRFDHGAIFLLIAGTYLAPLMHTLHGAWRVSMVAVVGGIAIAGVIMKLVWIDCPRWIGTAIYMAMGWLVLVPAHLVIPRLSTPGLVLLVAGGAAYSLGALVYAVEAPDPLPGRFGHHEIWHLFVLAGAASHYAFMLDLVGRPYPSAIL